MAIPFIVPSRVFRSRTEAKNYIRDEILRAYDIRQAIPTDSVHHQLLLEVLELHADAVDKIGPGIVHFYVEETWRLPGREAVGRDQRALMVVRSDGKAVDWSYHHVIDSPTPAANVKSALAFALETSRLERRDADFASGPVTCAITGQVIPQKHQADTRHLDPTWHELTTGFVGTIGGWGAVETHSGKGGAFVGRDVEDVALRDAWLRYYAANGKPVYVKNELAERD
ncbi:DCL family protein [Agrococcus jenensis]|uniref:DCL family protein n=1 Tax=Agrococcus jenensis TaxID=46353 RepID=UPI000F4C9457|nr:DCL family protein [Agrococcus jenensis]